MPSSTSNSSQRAPHGPWLKTWLVAVLLTVSMVGGAEWFWRAREHRPTVVDDADLWSVHRDKVYAGQRSSVVLLGSSRMLIGFSTDAFRQQFPDVPLVQLAVAGSHCVAPLHDLGDDRKFVGTAICEVTPPWLRRAYWETQRPYVEHYHKRLSLERKVNVWCAQSLQSRLAVLNPRVSIASTIESVWQDRAMPGPNYTYGQNDRSLVVDYQALVAREETPEKYAARMQKHFREMSEDRPSPEQWLEDMRYLERTVEKIQRRGGRVVFVRFPVSGRLCDIEQQLYPRAEYWDRFAEMTSAETIHFADTPGMQDLRCPEDSHLDMRDTPRFTLALCQELSRRKLLGLSPSRDATPVDSTRTVSTAGKIDSSDHLEGGSPQLVRVEEPAARD